jgi:hypothetical protein
MRTSILGTFFLASLTEIQEGACWYSDALQFCHTIAEKHGLSAETVAGVVAALSPQNRWERNMLDAERLIDLYILGGEDAAKEYKVATYGINKDKALKILALHDLNLSTIPEILNGQKVKAFYHCILGSDRHVCVDGHAYSIWLGERVTTNDTPKITSKLYNKISEDYIEATKKINEILGTMYTPADVQAITWITHRNLYLNRSI